MTGPAHPPRPRPLPLPVPLPPEDRRLSPCTGWTRAHWVALADGLLAAAWRWAGPRGALLHLPGPASVSGTRSDGLEGYARTFLAAAFRVAGGGGSDPHGWLPRYAEGLAAGTAAPGRADAVSWPPVRGHAEAGQPMVESASVALGLRLTRPWLWDRLEPGVRERAAEWLRGALRHTPAPNNWYLFPLTVAGFLREAGYGDAETDRAVERGLELLDGWYRGDGWYADGDGRAFDHYNGWALHLYPVLHAHLAADARLLARLGPRLRAYLEGHGLLFGGDGAPVHAGRSLTYRFAAGAAVALGALTGHTPHRPGASRRLLSGCARYFLDRGALTPDGLLSLGWHGPHAPTCQAYSGPASPYWAAKGLLGLLAGPDHPLWTAREEPAPAEQRDRVLALPAPGLLVQATARDGLVRLHNHGSDAVRPHEGESADDEDPLYARLAHSTATGPTCRTNEPDNHLAVEVPGPRGAVRSARRRIRPLGAGAAADGGWGWAASWHVPVFPGGAPTVPGLRVESVTVARGHDELRIHRVCGAPDGARALLSGWATAAPARGADRGAVPAAVREAGGPVSALYGLHGWDGAGPRLVPAPAGTAFTRWAAVPRLSGPVAGTAVLVALARLDAGGAGAAGGPGAGEDGRAGPDGAREAARVAAAGPDGVEVVWTADGSRTVVRFAPLAVSLEPPG